jgi:hypothetical protein
MCTNHWNYLRRLVKFEFKQAIQEGKEPGAVDRIEKIFNRETGADRASLEAIWEKLQQVPLRDDFSFNEPSDLKSIRSLRAAAPATIDNQLSGGALFDRLYGAWLGRCAGCTLGKPVEVCTAIPDNDPFTGQQRIKAYLESFGPGYYPLSDYIPGKDSYDKSPLKLIRPECMRGNIEYMEEDDDMRYTIIGQIVLDENHAAFTTGHVARAWLRNIPIQWVCTAEAIAYRNLAFRYAVHCGEWPKTSIDWDWVAAYQNPWREWIGAQIRADSWGYGAPGNPELAAEFAWRDARMSHVKNGIYGEMFVAAMIAAAFSTDDPRAIIEAGLGQIPSTSRLYADMRTVIDICDGYNNDAQHFEEALTDINEKLRHYGTVHTISNAGIVVAALLLGNGDFEKTATIAVMAGLDTDCNGATVGSICGAMCGAEALPQKWTAPFNDTIKERIVGYNPISISECARRSVQIVEQIRSNHAKAQALNSIPDELVLQ